MANTVSAGELFSLVLVGAFWGCTNPLLQRGAATLEEATPEKKDSNDTASFLDSLRNAFGKFRHVGVWLPYALNQAGSLIFYVLLGSTDLSLAVPICNALALVFSCLTSFYLGERVDKPFRAIAGSSLVMLGVAICMMSKSNDESLGSDKIEPQEL